MKRMKLTAYVLGLLTAGFTLQSCDNDDDDNWELRRPTALVTVRPQADGKFTLQLDNSTTLFPSNMDKSPYGDKEVRALVNYTKEYTEDGSFTADKIRSVHINWIDSIRTKMPVPTLGEENDTKYGKDPIEIVRDWVTVAEDGYLTLRIRTTWGVVNTPHYINLLTGVNPENPYELELRHDARGDVGGYFADALIAFNLNDLPRTDDKNVKIKLNWQSFSGKKSIEFELYLRPQEEKEYPVMEHNKMVK